MKKLSKVVSIVLSLALCLGMASPAFAASFTDLQNAIDGNGGTEFTYTAEDGTTSTRYGYAENKAEDGTVSWGIHAWDDEGTGRNIQLNEEVKREKNDNQSITISDKNVALDLNGAQITNSTDYYTVKVTGADAVLTVNDNSAQKAGSITTTKAGILADEKAVVNIQGGSIKSGFSGVDVTGGAHLNVSGESTSIISGSHGIWAKGDSVINVEGGTIYGTNRGITLTEKSQLTVDGEKTSITGNKEFGISLQWNSTATCNILDGTVNTNNADWQALNLGTNAILNMSGGSVGGASLNGKASISGGTMVGNMKVNADTVDISVTGGTVNKELEEYVPEHGYIITDNGNDTITVDPCNHNYELTSNTATCTVAGVGTYVCGGCGDIKEEATPPLAHTPGDPVRENEVAAQVGVTGSYDEVVYCSVCGGEISRVTRTTDPLDPPEIPDNPGTIIPDPDVPMADGTGTDTATIADQTVPLAGLTPVARLLEELRQYAEIPEAELPEDFKWIDHEYAQAISWGLQAGLVTDTEEEPFDPDEVLTVGIMREILANFAKRCMDLDDFVVTLTGEDDELVMDLGERLTVFYGELEDHQETPEENAA